MYKVTDTCRIDGRLYERGTELETIADAGTLVALGILETLTDSGKERKQRKAAHRKGTEVKEPEEEQDDV